MDSGYRAVLFDLDGTVLDTSAGILKAVDEAIAVCGLPDISPERKRSMIGPPIDRSFRAIYGLSEERAAEAAAAFRKAYAEKYLLEAVAYPGILELLQVLRANGWKTGVATYKRDDYAQRLMEQKGLLALCDVALGSDGKKQTKADIIELCMRSLKCGPSSVVMVGDTVHDWEGAEAAGAGFVGVTYGFGFTSPDEIRALHALGAAESVPQLREIFGRLRGQRRI